MGGIRLMHLVGVFKPNLFLFEFIELLWEIFYEFFLRVCEYICLGKCVCCLKVFDGLDEGMGCRRDVCVCIYVCLYER